MHITINSLREARKKKVLIKVLSVFADDASDAKCKRIFTVAGVMGTQEEWDALEIKWLARTGGKIFHATDCDSDKGDFKDIPHEENKKLYKDLIKFLSESPLMGISSSMDVNAYRTYIQNDLKEVPYFHCFIRVIIELVKLTRLIIPKQKVRFTFDINHKVQYNAAFLYEKCMVNMPEYKEHTDYMDQELGFATSKVIGIQVADLFARESMKHFDNIYGPLSMQVLLGTHRFTPHYFERSYFEAFAKNFQALEKRSGISGEKYSIWLKEHNCLDNLENRTRYLIYLDSENQES